MPPVVREGAAHMSARASDADRRSFVPPPPPVVPPFAAPSSLPRTGAGWRPPAGYASAAPSSGVGHSRTLPGKRAGQVGSGPHNRPHASASASGRRHHSSGKAPQNKKPMAQNGPRTQLLRKKLGKKGSKRGAPDAVSANSSKRPRPAKPP
jgi:hypothetical protein